MNQLLGDLHLLKTNVQAWEIKPSSLELENHCAISKYFNERTQQESSAALL